MTTLPFAASPLTLRALVLSLACLGGAALAQTSAQQPPQQPPTDQAPPDQPPMDDQWRISAGVGAISGPSFPGSDQTKLRAIPMLSARYGRWFIGGGPEAGGEGLGLGAMLYRDRQWQLGASLGLGLDKARKESDDSRLAGLGDIAGTTRASMFARFSEGWMGARANVSTDIGAHQQGTQAGLDLEARLRLSSGLMLSAGPGVRWGDQRYTQTFFGIDAVQSAASGRAAYNPGAGLTDTHFSVGANYELTPQVGLGMRLTTSRLQGDAARSPLAFDKSPVSVGLFGTYRF